MGKSLEVSIYGEIDIDVICSSHHYRHLEFEANPDVVIKVDPCPGCLSEAREEQRIKSEE